MSVRALPLGVARARLRRRHFTGRAFMWVSLAATLAGVAMLVILLIDVLVDGLTQVDWGFVSSYPSRFPDQAGIRSALLGSLWLIALTAAFAFPLAVGAAIYLEEYARDNWLARIITINISNLAGVPSIIYGLLGLGLFVRTFGFGRSILAGALTMALLVLPLVIVASREALKAVPSSLREGAYALGATRWQVVRRTVLPTAMPGILTGTILALSRAIGETAPLITIGALTYIAFDPSGPMDLFTVLPIQVFNWVSLPQKDFHDLAAGGIVILLIVLVIANSLAIFLRSRLERRTRW